MVSKEEKEISERRHLRELGEIYAPEMGVMEVAERHAEEQAEKRKGGAEKAKSRKTEGVPDVRKALIFLVFAIAAFAFNYVTGWQFALSFLISIITAVVFFLLAKGTKEVKLVIPLISIDIVSLMITEYLPTWSIVSTMILVRMLLWLVFAVLFFMYSFLVSRRKGYLPTIIMVLIIAFATFFAFPYVNDVYGAEMLEHQVKYAGAYKQMAEIKEAGYKQVNESVSSFKRTWMAIWRCIIKGGGDVACYNKIMNPPKPELEITGMEDKTIKEYTKVEFVKTESFPSEIQQAFPQPIPIQMNAESPQKAIKIDLSCRFKTVGKEFAGIVKPKDNYYIKEPIKITLTCSIPGGFEVAGDYYAVFEARVDGILTESRLKRLFVGENITAERENELIKIHSLENKEPSRSADEFADFSIGVGTPLTNPILKNEDEQPLLGNLINKANGMITGVKRIAIELPEDIGINEEYGCEDFRFYNNELVFENEEKLRQIDFSRIKKGQKILLLGCFLKIPEYLRNTETAKERSFKSIMEYSYKIEAQQPFRVIPRMNITG